MPATTPESAARVKKLAIWYNQILNIGWSVVSFGPVGYFCYQYLSLAWVYVFTSVSLLGMLLPLRFFNALQLSATTALYHKIGIRTVKKYTQDGDLINRQIRKKYPQYRVADNYSSLRKQVNKAYYIEKIHFGMGLFFLFTSLFAFIKGYMGWALVITVCNIVFNLYPIFLQQYNRLRLRTLLNRHPVK